MFAAKCYRLLIAKLVLLCFCLLWPRVASAAATQPALIVGQVQVLEDRSATATLDQILARHTEFTDLQTTAPNYGFTSSAYWLRIPVQNGQPAASTFYLDIKNPLVDYATLYLLRDGRVQTTRQSGAQVAGQLRPYLAATLVLPFPLAANEAAVVYVRVYSLGMALFVPFEVIAETALVDAASFGWVLNSAILSIIGAMLIYNGLLFSLLRSRLYLYYVLYLFTGAVGITSLNGLGPVYFYPNNTWLGSNAIPVSTGISLALMIFFAREFLETRAHRWLDRWAWFFISWALLLSAGAFWLPLRFSFQMSTIIAFIYPSFCFVAGLIAWRRGNTEVRFFLIGQISSWCGLIWISLHSIGLLPYHPLTYQSPALGAVADALLLSLALGDRIRIFQRAQLAAEEQARRNLEIRSDELERLVAERTAEIKTLQGVLPICASCKKIRDDDGAWQQLETYISQHTDTQFSHGICTDCMEKLYPEIQRKRQQKSAIQQNG